MTSRPLPPAGTVYLHLLSLPRTPEEIAGLRAHLAPDELARAARLKSAPVAERYIASRGLLREILGGYLGVVAGQVRLVTRQGGKPCLAQGGGRLHFNLAHAGPHFLLAVASDRAVGVDLECIDPEKSLTQMARLIFSEAELAQWERLATSRRVEAFYRCWVRKEACLKGNGTGLALPASGIELFAPDWQAIPVVDCGQRRWQLFEIAAPPGYCAALAVECRGEQQPPPQLVWIDQENFGE